MERGHYTYFDNKHGVDFPYHQLDGIPSKEDLRDEVLAKVQQLMRYVAEWVLEYQPTDMQDRNRVVSSKALAAMCVIVGEAYLLNTNRHADVCRASKICGLSEANFRRYLISFHKFLDNKIEENNK